MSDKANFLKVLFDDDERTCFTSFVDGIAYYSVHDDAQWDSNFFSINPLTGDRKDSNIAQYRNFLFETDSLTLEQQRILFDKAAIPFSTGVFSGKKSYHYILSLKEPVSDKETYTHIWRQIAAYLNAVATELGFRSSSSSIIDQSCKNPSRLSRFPGALRDGVKQNLLFVNRRLTTDELNDILAKCPEIEKPAPRRFKSVSPLDDQEGQLSLRTQHFLRTGKDYKNEYSWHNLFLLAAKDMKAQNFSYEEAFSLLEGITGHLDDSHDIPQLDYAYSDGSFEMEHRSVSKLHDFLQGSYWLFDIEDDTDNFVFNPELGLIKTISKTAIKRALSKDEFTDLIANRTLDCELKYEPFSQKILYHGDDELDVFNRYNPPFWKKDYFYHKTEIPKSNLPEIYHDFFMHFVNGNKDSYEYLLDWFANGLKRKNRTYLLCVTAKGTGKNVLHDIMERVHGKANSIITNDTVLKEKFNHQLKDKTLITFNEVDIRRDAEIDRLKAYADDYMSIEGKGKDAVQVRNFASVLIYSNRSGAVRVEADDRRFSVLDLTDTKLQLSKYFKHTNDGSYDEDAFQRKIDSLFKDDTIEDLARFLWHRDITHNMNFPYRSEKYQEMIESALTEWEHLMLEKILPLNVGKTIEIRRVQKMILNEFWSLRQLGRSKLKDFVKNYPEHFEWKRDGSVRAIKFIKPYYPGKTNADKRFTFK